jgi:hypothetical protein
MQLQFTPFCLIATIGSVYLENEILFNNQRLINEIFSLTILIHFIFYL